MQVQKVQNNNCSTTFQSSFVKAKDLKGAFAMAKFEKKPAFAKAVEKLLNDGKTDVLNITTKHRPGSGSYYQMDLKVNDKVVDTVKYENGVTSGQKIQQALDAKDLVIKYAGLENAVLADRPASRIEKQLNKLEKRIFG